jgi:hypothetical protein
MAIVSVIVAFSSCTYNNEETLYPVVPSCDSTNVSYKDKVKPILIKNQCLDCHNNNNMSGGINLETYSDVKIQANNTRLLLSITHDSQVSPMPKGGGKLTICEIGSLRNWINEGTKDN